MLQAVVHPEQRTDASRDLAIELSGGLQCSRLAVIQATTHRLPLANSRICICTRIQLSDRMRLICCRVDTLAICVFVYSCSGQASGLLTERARTSLLSLSFTPAWHVFSLDVSAAKARM